MSPKVLLRKKILARREGISAPLRRTKSTKIFQKLFRDPDFQKARHVALYYGIAPEVGTRPFLKKIIRSKKLYLPAIDPKGKELVLRRVFTISKNLVKGAYGIMEPDRSCRSCPADRMDLIVVPGVAFDRRGGRLGRGGGYYDRLLGEAWKIPKIGLCFREQLVKKVPMNKHDIGMDRVITD